MEGKRKELETLQNKFQAELEKFTKAQTKNEKLMRLTGQLETQLHENEMVKEELTFAKEDGKVFKLVGDVLLPQTLEEATSNVNRRIEYIQSETKRNTEAMAANKAEMMALRDTVTGLEQQIQKLQMALGTPQAC